MLRPILTFRSERVFHSLSQFKGGWGTVWDFNSELWDLIFTQTFARYRNCPRFRDSQVFLAQCWLCLVKYLFCKFFGGNFASRWRCTLPQLLQSFRPLIGNESLFRIRCVGHSFLPAIFISIYRWIAAFCIQFLINRYLHFFLFLASYLRIHGGHSIAPKTTSASP